MIIMFIGPSSSGKDLFYKKTLGKYNFNKIILYTTRPIRTNEENGKDYYFISMDEMNKLEMENKLVERRDYDTVHGTWSYATRGDNIDLNNNYLVINTWEGYQKYLNYFGPNVVYPFYFELDPGIRLERALKREQQQEIKRYEELCRRFLSDSKDFTPELIKKYNPIIIDNNGTIEETNKQIDENIKKLIKK